LKRAHPPPRGDVVYVALDNPELFTNTPLINVYSAEVDDQVSEEILTGGSSWQQLHCDHVVHTSGGDADSPPSGLTSGGSINDTLYPWPAVDGDVSDSVELHTHGLRVGYRPLTVGMTDERPNLTEALGMLPFNVQLDPNILLVPVQVAVLYSDSYPLDDARLDSQLVLWDLYSQLASQSQETHPIEQPPFQELYSTSRSWANWISRGQNGTYRFENAYTPDSIWDWCGIQFRLVNEWEVPVTDDITTPPNSACGFGNDELAPLITNYESIVSMLPGFRSDVPTLVVMNRCTCPDFLSFEGGHGVSVIDQPEFCAGLQTTDPLVVAHELGHVFGMCDAYLPGSKGGCPGDGFEQLCTGANPKYAIMCDGGATVPTQTECNQARAAAASYAANFHWPR
jgi:hypothetical protein